MNKNKANEFRRLRYNMQNGKMTLREILHKLEFDEPNKKVCVMRFGNIVGLDTAFNLLNYSSDYFRRFLHYSVDVSDNDQFQQSSMIYIIF